MLGQKAQRRETRLAAALERERAAAETRTAMIEAAQLQYESDPAFRAEVDEDLAARRRAQQVVGLISVVAAGALR